MKISTLIKQLEEIKEKYGDLPILIYEQGFGGHALLTFGRCEKSEMYAGSLLEDDNLDEKQVKEIIPEYDGNEDSLDKDFDYVQISGGSMIYSS